MTAALAGPARHARVVLAPGATLIEAISDVMAGLGWASATLLLLGGPMARAVYHTSMLTPRGPRWIDYGPPQDVVPAPWLVMGSATFGPGLDGSAALHCHAMLTGGGGPVGGPVGSPVGGHLSPHLCVLGPDGLVAHATSAEAAGFQVRRDLASGFDLLTPA